MRIGKEFYLQNAKELAPKLLGKLLCRRIDGEIVKQRITETEAYYGEEDTACHAHRGKTERTKLLYEEGGIAYIYLCYGIHYLLNVVTGEKDFPQAVLIRGLSDYKGPGRLTKALKIGKSLNGEDLLVSTRLWLEDDGFQADYVTSKRIGIDYAAEEDRERLWRFNLIEKGEKSISCSNKSRS